MTWRIVEITSSSKLEYRLNYLVVRNTEGTRKVYIPEIAVLIIESTAVSITAALLCELIKRKIKVIFCDEKRNPYSELIPYYGSHDCVRKLRDQSSWNYEIKEQAWTRIVRDKICKQRDVLIRWDHEKQASMLDGYINEIDEYDSSNREGHAAKVYFNVIFGDEFTRGFPDPINSALDYGYAILLSAFNREVSVSGYYTQIGIFHDNVFNQFNLSCDLIESFRPIVDECVLEMNPTEFGSAEKKKLVDLLNSIVYISGKQNYLINAIRVYVQSFFLAMETNDIEKMVSYEVKIHESDCVL